MFDFVGDFYDAAEQQMMNESIHMGVATPRRGTNTTIAQMTKTGYLHKRSDHLKQWRKRFLVADSIYLRISENEDGKKLKIVDIRDYALKWHSRVGDRYVFSFQLLKGKKGIRYKTLIFGEKEEINVKSWYNFFRDTQNCDGQALNQTFNQLSTLNISQILDDNPSPKLEPLEKPGMILQQDNRKTSEDSIGKELKELEEKNDKKQEIVCSSNSDRTDGEGEGSESEPEPEVETQKEIVDEHLLPSEPPAWLEEIFNSYIKGSDQWEIENMKNFTAKHIADRWEIISDQDGAKILQDVKTPTVFRCLFTYKKHKVDQILKILLDIKNRDSWDESFDKCTVLSYAPSTKQYMIHQVTKPFGFLYFPREFVYLRYTFKSKGTYFVVDRSIDGGDKVPKSVKCPRGLIEYAVYQLVQEGEDTHLNLLINITNGGVVTSGQDTKITQFALENYREMKKVFNEYTDDYESEFVGVPDSTMKKQEKEKEIHFKGRRPDNSLTMIYEGKETLKLETIIPENEKKVEEDKIVEDYKLEDIKMDQTEILKETIMPPIDNRNEMELYKSRLEKTTTKKHASECVDKKLPIQKLSPQDMNKKLEDANGVHFLYQKCWRRDTNGGLELIDKDLVERQKKVLSHFLKNMGKNLLEGKSIMNVSMPITIFSTDSILQRSAVTFGYAPHFLAKAGEQTNKLEAFKLVLTFFYSMCHIGLTQEKPFNPILGETYQGLLGGVEVSCEQISHHPPISAVFMKTDKYFIHGTYNVEASLGPNSANAIQNGRICVTLPSLGMNLYCYAPTAVITGTVMGKRLFNWSKKLKLYEPKMNLYGEIHFNPDEKGLISGLFSKKGSDSDTVRGKIYEVTPEFIESIHGKNGLKAKFDEKTHFVKELSIIEGVWTSYLEIDGKKYWEVEKLRPYQLIDLPNKALPSDSTYREDMIYRQMGDFTQGQVEKERLENIQRNDRKLRAKVHGKKH